MGWRAKSGDVAAVSSVSLDQDQEDEEEEEEIARLQGAEEGPQEFKCGCVIALALVPYYVCELYDMSGLRARVLNVHHVVFTMHLLARHQQDDVAGLGDPLETDRDVCSATLAFAFPLSRPADNGH